MPSCPPIGPSPRPIVVLGPTAGGKSDLAASLAQQLGGFVIGADSMQVYRHLDAGTAKPPQALRKKVRHEGVDIVEPGEKFSVHDWLKQTNTLIETGLAENKTPVIVGGTNLYLKALLEGLFDGPGQEPAFRATLHDVPDTELHARLTAVDAQAANRIAVADRQRLTRALEVFHLTGQPISALQTQWAEETAAQTTYHHNPMLIGLRWAVDDINPRINLRVKAMFTPDKVDPQLAADVCINGESLPDEVARLDAAGLLPPGSQCAEALGYKQVLGAIAPDRHPRAADKQIATLDDAFERTKILTRRFAKQQRTWLKRFRNVQWIDMPHENAVNAAMQLIREG